MTDGCTGAKQAAEKGRFWATRGAKHTSGAKNLSVN
jgi:hypothetical protein